MAKKNIAAGIVAGLLGGALQGVNAHLDNKIHQRQLDESSQRILQRQKEYNDYVNEQEQLRKQQEAEQKAKYDAEQRSTVGTLLKGEETSLTGFNPRFKFPYTKQVPLSEQRTADLMMSLDDNSLQRYNTIKKEKEVKKEDLYQFDKKLYRYKPDGTIDIENPILEKEPEEQEVTKSYFTDADKVPGLGPNFAGQKVEVTQRYKGKNLISTNYGNPIKIESDYGDYGKIKVLSPEAKKIVSKMKEERTLDNAEMEVAYKRGDVFKPITKVIKSVDENGNETQEEQVYYSKKTFDELRELRNTKRRKNIEALKNLIGPQNLSYYNQVYDKYKDAWETKLPRKTGERKSSGANENFGAFNEIKTSVNEAFKKGKISAAVYELYNNLVDEEFGLTLDME